MTEATVATAAATKTKRVRLAKATAPTAEVKAKPAPKAKAVKPDVAPKPAPKAKVEKPSQPLHTFSTDYDGPSTALNTRPSRTRIDSTRFGQFAALSLTDRDQKSLQAMRSQFGGKPFERLNFDAGIIKRLGERGCLTYVGGEGVNEQYKLTNKGLGKAEPRTKQAA